MWQQDIGTPSQTTSGSSDEQGVVVTDLFSMDVDWTEFGISLGVLGAAAVVALVLHAIVFAIAARLASKTATVVDQSIVRNARGPMRLLMPTLGAQMVLASEAFPGSLTGLLRHALSLVLIAGVAWLVIRSSKVLQDFAAERYDVSASDNLNARRIHTQFSVLRRVITMLTVIVAGAVMLMTFPSIRQLGTSILASAGIAGIVVGMAARPALENLIAGVQIALAQPIRLDDVVIVEGEWGRIEEITSTYVVVKIWDLRRLVVPLSYFIEKPFQNWTRVTAQVMGTVFIDVDFTVPVERIREEFKNIVEASDLWDGKVCGLVVTDAQNDRVQLRGLVSAANSGDAWDLRCHAREKLVEFLQRDYPDCLPRVRAEISGSDPLFGRSDQSADPTSSSSNGT